MNRKSKGGSLQKTSHTVSQKLANPNDNKNLFSSSNQTHFLTTEPEHITLLKKFSNKKSKFHHHFASHTQLISTAFHQNVYIPPHLNSSQVFTCMTSQCKNWKSRPSSSIKSAKKLNYNQMYNQLEERYQKTLLTGSRLRKWTSPSKIKQLVEEDRIRYQVRKPYQLFVEEDNQSQESSDYCGQVAQSRHQKKMNE